LTLPGLHGGNAGGPKGEHNGAYRTGRRHERLAYPRAGTKAKGEVHEGKIDIPGLERTAVADLGAWQP
jgi:hypothetical protein